jgi:hypothetical protein
MKNQLDIIADVEGLGRIVEAKSDFYTELQQLKEANARLISPRNEAYARIHTQGKENIGKSYGTRTSAGFEYAKAQLPIFRVKSRLTNLKLAKLAVEANSAGNYFHTDSTKEYRDSLEQAEKDNSKEPVKRNVIVLPSRSEFTMSDKQNWEIYQAILKDQAKPYFELNGPIEVYPLDEKIVDVQDGTILTHLWFWGLDGGSGFGGCDGGLCDGSGARGVLRESAEGTSPKILKLLYTQRQITAELNRFSRLEREIQKSRQFIESLRQ